MFLRCHTSPWVEESLSVANGSTRGSRSTSAGANITAMSGCVAIDAGMRKLNASKAISKRKPKAAQAEGKMYWYAQWRENGSPRSKELGLCSAMTRAQAEGILSEILQPINAAAGSKSVHCANHTFGQFVESVYLPVCVGRWKVSTAMTEVDRIKYHLIQPLGGQALKGITREEMQTLLNTRAETLSRSVVSHLRFRLRSIFELALSEGLVDRNPATTLYTPKSCRPGRERRVLTTDDFKMVINALDLREKIIFGLRRSKACAREKSLRCRSAISISRKAA